MNTSSPVFTDYLCELEEINKRILDIDPRAYDKTRNYLNGRVTWLSPFITHGVINTHQIAQSVLQDHKAKSCYRLLFELGWREFFHRTWQLAEQDIFDDMRSAQVAVRSNELPEAMINATTGIEVVDECLQRLQDQGLMHNHARMWVAGIVCNMAGTYWKEPARWLHYHLLDGDLASNTLSWQWIAGTFSHKQYLANQDNVNKYSNSSQSGSWLDIAYEEFDNFSPPQHMLTRCKFEYEQTLPGKPISSCADAFSGSLALRSIWNLNPLWRTDIAKHIVFIDTQLAEQWPMSNKRWRFVEHWATHCNAEIYTGTIDQLKHACAGVSVTREQYTACNDWPGQVTERDWLYPMPENDFSSFSQYFKQVKKHVGL
jgi:deoxyribodipyrimidine photo-lyase